MRSGFVRIAPARASPSSSSFARGSSGGKRRKKSMSMRSARYVSRAALPATRQRTSGEWRRFATVFHPALSQSTVSGKPKQPEWLRVELYAFWPVGIYEFDNVRIEVVGHEEIQPPPQQPAAAKEPGKPAKPLKDDEFPEF